MKNEKKETFLEKSVSIRKDNINNNLKPGDNTENKHKISEEDKNKFLIKEIEFLKRENSYKQQEIIEIKEKLKKMEKGNNIINQKIDEYLKKSESQMLKTLQETKENFEKIIQEERLSTNLKLSESVKIYEDETRELKKEIDNLNCII